MRVIAALWCAAALPALSSAALPPPADILATLNLVFSDFASRTTDTPCGWTRGAYFFGHSEAYNVTGSPAMRAFAESWADANHYECGGSFNANDFACGWGYSTLYRAAPADYKLALGVTMARLQASPEFKSYWASWVDALAMSISQFIDYSSLLGLPSLLAGAQLAYDQTKNGGPLGPAGRQPGLWSPDNGLFWRDYTYINQTSPNGKKVFWGRGNGWAASMLARALSLPALPAGPLRDDFSATLTAMAATLATAQGADGFWRANILDAAAFPDPETTSTGAFTYAIASGIRSGLLPAATYMPVVEAAWAGLTSIAVNASGYVGHCQPVGGGPAPAPPTSTSDFCTGFVLLAGAEVFRLAKGV